MTTVAETIRSLTLDHINKNRGLVLGQNLTAVGWVGGTVPEMEACSDPSTSGGIIELPTSDCSNSAVAVGLGLAGRRPIYIIRYQGFAWYNAVTIVNYAAKSKEMWGVPCPMFVRAIAMEGGIGPVATGAHHSMVMRMPGIQVFAPMTPREWQEAWDWFLEHDDPVYCSEHRLSFPTSDELYGRTAFKSDIILVGISAARLELKKAADELSKWGYDVSIHHVSCLKPYKPDAKLLECVRMSAFGCLVVVVDSDYSVCGAAEHVAYKIHGETGVAVKALGLADKTAGFAVACDNLTPNAVEIAKFARDNR